MGQRWNPAVFIEQCRRGNHGTDPPPDHAEFDLPPQVGDRFQQVTETLGLTKRTNEKNTEFVSPTSRVIARRQSAIRHDMDGRLQTGSARHTLFCKCAGSYHY